MGESIEVSEAKRRFPMQLPYNREFETRAREQDAFIAGWRAALASCGSEKRAEWKAERTKVRHTFETDNCVTNECDCALAEQGETRWEYGTRRSVTDGWERGDRYGEREYVDARSVSDRVGSDGSTVTGVRDMTRAVRRRKAGPWEPVTNTESEGEK